MKTYGRMCATMERTEAPVEDIERPQLDWVQDGWLRVVEHFRRQDREVLEATSGDELFERYEDNAGLVVTCYEQSVSAEYQSRRSRTQLKTGLIKKVFSLDGVDDDGTAYAELIEDMRAEIPFRKLEDFDAIVSRMEQEQLTEQQRAAIKRFALAWAMQEAGYSLPRNVFLRVSRDRKATGLPLVLERGRKKGHGS